MNLANDIQTLLQSYGGWGVAALAILAVIYLYNDFKKVIAKKDELLAETQKEHHTEIVAVVKECSGVMKVVNENLERCERRQEARNG